MKKRIRIILILMIACILGINLFQGYWLYQSYQFNRRDFGQAVNEALSSALKKQELADAERTLRIRFDSFPGPKWLALGKSHSSESIGTAFSARKKFFFRKTADTTLASVGEAQKIFVIETQDSADAMPVHLMADTLARQISSLLILNKFYQRHFDLEHFDSLFTAELHNREIQASYRLDTFRIEAPDTLSNALFAENADGIVNSKEWWQMAKKAIQVKQNEANAKTYKSQVRPVNLSSNLFMQATFYNPAYLILRRMAGLLTGSLLLFLLTTGCLVYMLRTILTQKKLSEIKNDFINNMTHELKTPIATVSAAVEALQHFDALEDRKKSRDYLDISRRELNRLSGLVGKVLSMAVEERRDLELRPEAVDVVRLIEDLLEKHRIRTEKPLQLRFEHDLETAVVRVDKTHFTNAINNLIDNAIKYSPSEADVLIRCAREQDWLRISVKDNGIGIPKEYQQCIFERFFRVPHGDLHEVKGFGLGLSYVKKIIEKHGGKIQVVSDLRGGSEFIVQVPACCSFEF
jgi:two-component system phosphate regulon sensor histidine kinase PhoR